MTPEELDAIEARADAATPGPWTMQNLLPTTDEGFAQADAIVGAKPVLIVNDEVEMLEASVDNLLFITHARIDVPALVTEVERLQYRRDKALELAWQLGQIEGPHHKAWVIDQIVRWLVDDGAYEAWVQDYTDEGEYKWSEGIAP